MTLEFLPQAEEEAAEAIAYYERVEPGLGVRLREEIESATAAILSHPLLWRQRHGGYRRVNLPEFPFYVAYVLRGERVRVIAMVTVLAGQLTFVGARTRAAKSPL